MRKLKLESLQVESFETTGTGWMPRGTVAGNATPDTDTDISWCTECIQSMDLPCEPTYDPAVSTCTGGDYTYFGCSFGCTVETECCAP